MLKFGAKFVAAARAMLRAMLRVINFNLWYPVTLYLDGPEF